jgi:hypothetical protein
MGSVRKLRREAVAAPAAGSILLFSPAMQRGILDAAREARMAESVRPVLPTVGCRATPDGHSGEPPGCGMLDRPRIGSTMARAVVKPTVFNRLVGFLSGFSSSLQWVVSPKKSAGRLKSARQA